MTRFHSLLPSVPAALLSFFFVPTSFQVPVNKKRVHQEQDAVPSSCSIKQSSFFVPQHFSRRTLPASTWSHLCFVLKVLKRPLLLPTNSEHVNAPAPLTFLSSTCPNNSLSFHIRRISRSFFQHQVFCSGLVPLSSGGSVPHGAPVIFHSDSAPH